MDPPLKPEHKAYLAAFAETRRMARDEALAAKEPDPIREAAGLPVGKQGDFVVNDSGGNIFGDDSASSVTDHNRPPEGQPGLWCQWVPNEDGTAIRWDGSEKFYHYADWIEYLIERFLTPWGYKLAGTVKWQGEERSDRGFICISNNKVFVNEKPTALDRMVEAITTPKKAKRKKL